MCQGRRNDILEEIAMLNGMDVSETCGHDVHKSKSRDAIGEDYGMTGRNIARYMRLNQIIDQIKEMVDDGAVAMVTAVNYRIYQKRNRNRYVRFWMSMVEK